MRTLALLLVLASVPVTAAAQGGQQSLALEVGFARDSVELLGGASPVALCWTSWLTGDLDATARVQWAFAARPDVRAADGSFEAGAGLRYSVATWGAVRAQLVADLAFVQVLGAPGPETSTSGSGVRLAGGGAFEIFFARDLSLSLVARATEVVLVSGEYGPGLTVAVGMAMYF